MMDIQINEEKPAICKLCFVCCDDFVKINHEIRKKLEFILINQVVLANEDSVCNSCLENLEKCYTFKLSYAKDCVKPLYRGDNAKLDPNICLLNKNEGHNNVNMLRNQPECKLCSRLIEHGKYVLLSDITTDPASLTALNQYLPEVDVNTHDSKICIPCHYLLQHYFQFVKNIPLFDQHINSDTYKLKGFCNANRTETSNTLEYAPKIELKPEIDHVDMKEYHEKGPYMTKEFCSDTQTEANKLEYPKTDVKFENEHVNFNKIKEHHKSEDDGEDDIKLEYEVEEETQDLDIKPNEVLNVDEAFKGNQDDHVATNQTSSTRTKAKTYYCHFCNDEMTKKTYLIDHLLTQHTTQTLINEDEFEYSCKICKYRTGRKFNLRRHMASQHKTSEEKLYRCSACTYQTKNKSNLNRHVIVHREESEVTMYKCEVCDYRTKHRSSLKQHRVSYHDELEVTMYQCEKCDFETKQKSNIKKHCRAHHKNSSEVSHNRLYRNYKTVIQNASRQMAEEKVTYHCDQCEFKTKYKSGVKRHKVLHQNESEVTLHKCDTCEFKTRHKHGLKLHRMIHKDESELTMYQCEQCEYKTKRKELMKRHILVHRDESQVTMYRCNACSYRSKHRESLKMHQMVHRDESELTMYQCDCRFKTRYRNVFKKHVTRCRQTEIGAASRQDEADVEVG